MRAQDLLHTCIPLFILVAFTSCGDKRTILDPVSATGHNLGMTVAPSVTFTSIGFTSKWHLYPDLGPGHNGMLYANEGGLPCFWRSVSEPGYDAGFYCVNHYCPDGDDNHPWHLALGYATDQNVHYLTQKQPGCTLTDAQGFTFYLCPWNVGGVPSCSSGDQPYGGTLIESVIPDEQTGTLYGYYHAEVPVPTCPTTKEKKIGAAYSTDHGKTWNDQGIIITAPAADVICNGALSPGDGDFSAILSGGYVYFLYTNFSGPELDQGICVARMAWSQRDNPVGNVYKFRLAILTGSSWTSPGLGGGETPVIRAVRNFQQVGYEGWWGPSIHYNTYIGKYVMVTNHTHGNWHDDSSIYISFADGLDPSSSQWTVPTLIPGSEGHLYPEIIGVANGETDRLAGQDARLYCSGRSDWTVHYNGL